MRSKIFLPLESPGTDATKKNTSEYATLMESLRLTQSILSLLVVSEYWVDIEMDIDRLSRRMGGGGRSLVRGRSSLTDCCHRLVWGTW